MGTASSPPQVQATHDDGHFDGAAGRRIYHQAWTPEGDLRAVVVVAHGLAEHGGRYSHLVERIVPEGFAVHAIDHRGHGRSEGTRAQIDRMDHVISDLDHLVDLAHARHPDLPLFLLGHSMGGLIAITYAARHQAKLAGLLLSAPLLVTDAVPALLRLIGRVLSIVTPDRGLLDLDGAKVSRDAAEVTAYDDDPLNYRGKIPARTLQELATTMGAMEGDLLPRLTLPLLVMQGSADELVGPGGAELVDARAASADKQVERYAGFFHELFNEPAEDRRFPLDDTAAWLLAHS